MGTLTFSHTSTGSEPKPGLIESYVIQNWTGTFSFTISASSIGSGDIYNIDWRLVRSSDSFVCFASSSTMFGSTTSYTENWNVGVTGTWNATNWDRFELRYGTASDRVDAGIVLTAVFDGAGITGGTSNSMALVYTLSTTTLDRDLDERYIPKAIMTTKGDVIVGAAATNPVRLGVGTDGYVLTSRSSASNGVAWEAGGGGGATLQYVNVQEQRASGTNAGAITSGAWRTRSLTTIVSDTASVATLASNQVTLPAGTWVVRASAPGLYVQRHQIRLQNVTSGTTILVGDNALNVVSGVGMTTVSTLSGAFTIAAGQALELQHRVQTTNAGTDGMGSAGGWGTEVYAQIEFWRLA